MPEPLSEERIAALVVQQLRDKPIVEPELLNQRDAARFMSLSVGGLKNLVAAGTVVETKLHGKPLYSRKHLLAVIERHTG